MRSSQKRARSTASASARRYDGSPSRPASENTEARIERTYEQAWKAWKTQKRDEATGYLAHILAAFLQYAGRYGSFTEQLFRLSLAIAEKALGPEHPDTGTSLDNLAELLRAKGDFEAAEPLYRRALAIAEKLKGPEHPATAISLNNLAGLAFD